MSVEWKPYRDYEQYPKQPCCVWLKQQDGTVLAGIFDWRMRKDGRGLYFMHDGWLVGWNSGDSAIVEWAERDPTQIEWKE